ncbi:hypothetical protein [Paenibacillus sp. Leaf72]|uniref:hypothetical protein n=1 Tax=Paenibacillus sp. Leaf72 TaxID=1736234 RepID=UPI0006F218E0|nr:hypothetical protein [Paenibacillus sp. Leaf72]KQO14141.1 hypothetical protein ASF12_29525 [Paenibacillus sp. Leaf72]
MEKLTRAVLEEEQKDQRNFPTAEVLKARPKLLAAMALLATVMLFRHPAALNGAAGCFSFRGEEGRKEEACGGQERKA